MNNLQEREQLFKNDIRKEEFPDKVKREFFQYWSEPNRSGTKMKFELEKTWETKRRLQRWVNNQNKWNARSNNTPANGNGNKQQGAYEILNRLRKIAGA